MRFEVNGTVMKFGIDSEAFEYAATKEKAESKPYNVVALEMTVEDFSDDAKDAQVMLVSAKAASKIRGTFQRENCIERLGSTSAEQKREGLHSVLDGKTKIYVVRHLSEDIRRAYIVDAAGSLHEKTLNIFVSSKTRDDHKGAPQ